MHITALQVKPVHAGMLLLDFLAQELDLSKRRAKALLDGRRVFVNRQPVWMARHRLRAGDRVETPGANAAATDGIVRILFEDGHFLVVDKPAGLLSNGEDSLETRLRRQRREPGLLAAHRLDRDTSGCLLFARSQEAFDAVVREFKAHRVKKTYHAIVAGRFQHKDFRLDQPIDGERAITVLRTLDANLEASHLQALIETGRTHQIRRHMASLGHPVLGDRQYGARLPVSGKAIQIARQMLHATGLDLQNPLTETRVVAHSPLPTDFRACLHLYRLT